MNLSDARVVLRPRTLTELFDLGWRYCGAGPVRRLYRRLGWWLLVPLWSLCVALRFGFNADWPVVWVVAVAGAIALEGVFTIAASRLMFEPEVRVRAVLWDFMRRSPSYFTALVLAALVLCIGAALFWVVFPAIWAVTIIAHLNEASLLERAGPLSALRRASRLVSGDWVRGFGLQCFLLAHAAGFILVFEAVGNRGLAEFVLQLGAPAGRLEWGGSAFALAGLLAAVPYVATVRFLAYLDRRTRQDAWDVQVACMAIVAQADATELGEEAA